jgi:RHS repeat-associated protein
LAGKLVYERINGANRQYFYLGSQLVAHQGAGEQAFIHPDLLGTTAAKSNSSGGVTKRLRYAPFGLEWGKTSAESGENEIGYTGHKHDNDIGLTYMQARYYDPVIGRFYSNDPIGFTNVHTFNRYAYVANNPYKYVDPSGMCSESPNASAETKCQDNTNMKIGKKGDNLIRTEETKRNDVHDDNFKNLTVGIGHRVLPKDKLVDGQIISDKKVEELFDADKTTAVNDVRTLVGSLRLSQNEFDALGDLTFNVGLTKLMDKTKNPGLHSAISAKDYGALGKQLIYTKANGSSAGGLQRRSNKRTAIFNEK